MKAIVSASTVLVAICPSAWGQPQLYRCFPNSGVTPTVRSEGITELVGDIVLQCTGGPAIPPGTLPQTAQVNLFLNMQVTSRILGTNGQSEALLLIDEPAPADAKVGVNVVPGDQQGSNAITYTVPVLSGSMTHTFRFTNIRANAAAASDSGKNEVAATLASPNPAFNLTAPIILGTIGPSYNVTAPFTSHLQSCEGNPETLTGATYLRFTEISPTAFKTRTLSPPNNNSPGPATPQSTPGIVYNSESGYYNPTLLTGTAGLADFGTRLRAVFNQIPNGVSVFVSGTNVRDPASPDAHAALTDSETGPFVPQVVDSLGFTKIPVLNGTASAVWEVIQANPNLSEHFDFAVIFQADPNAVPGPTTITARAGLSVPRFIDISKGKTSAFPISVARTNLLYPFITNIPGFDTGLAIANTTTDPFDTNPSMSVGTFGACSGTPLLQSSAGSMTLNFYGANSPPSGNALLGTTGIISPNVVPQIVTPSAQASTTSGPVSQPQATELGTRAAQSAWLSVTADTTTTPATLRISADPTGLPDGQYNGKVTVSSASPGVSAVSVPVVLNVQSKLPVFSSYAVTNAGSYAASVVAPGEAIVIFGKQFGPPTLAGLSLTNGKVATLIGDTRVLFDGVAAPMIYAVNGQVSCFVPFGVAGKTTADVQVEYLGVKSPPVTMVVLEAAPGLLTFDSSGGGLGAINNQDQSVNTPSNPAKAGDVITIYAVGIGQTNPAGEDGGLYPSSLPLPTQVLPIQVFVDGKQLPDADVLYAGPAPGAVQGVFQANLKLPSDVSHGNASVYLIVGTARTQPGVTVAVQ